MKDTWTDKAAVFISDDNDLEDHGVMYITKGDDWYITVAPVNSHEKGRVPIGYPEIRIRLSGTSQPDGFSDLVNMMHALGTEDYYRLLNLSESFAKKVSAQYINNEERKELEALKKSISSGIATPHSTHCCVEHGCKYGPEDYCPVVLGLETGTCPASYQCEDC